MNEVHVSTQVWRMGGECQAKRHVSIYNGQPCHGWHALADMDVIPKIHFELYLKECQRFYGGDVTIVQ